MFKIRVAEKSGASIEYQSPTPLDYSALAELQTKRLSVKAKYPKPQ